MATPKTREGFWREQDYAQYLRLVEEERIIYENAQRRSPYEGEKKQQFYGLLAAFYTRLIRIPSGEYNKSMAQCLNSTDIVETDDLVLYQKIVGYHARIKQQWLSYVGREISKSFGEDTFLADQITKERKKVPSCWNRFVL